MNDKQRRLREYLLTIVKPNGIYLLSIDKICRECGTERNVFMNDMIAVANVPYYIKRGKTTIQTHIFSRVIVKKKIILKHYKTLNMITNS